ncbi:MAG: response regulator [Anaerolineae bacterium]|nr:response regulator [Anaerolineae bacterium]
MGTLSREEIREALSCLNDNVGLAKASLAQHFSDINTAISIDERANYIRARLLEAIEVLRPARRAAFGSLESRHYDVLSLRYVEGMAVAEMSRELSLGRRQIHRDLQEAEGKLAEVLATLPGVATGYGQAPVAEGNSLRDELELLPYEAGPVELGEVLRTAAELLRPLADRYGTGIIWDAPEGASVWVMADHAVLKQVLVQLLSAAVQSSTAADVRIGVEQGEGAVTAHVRLCSDPRRLRLEQLSEVRRIASSKGIGCQVRAVADDQWEIILDLPRSRPFSVLVIEDNPSAVELYRRYLAPGTWEVEGVSDPRLAYEAATRVRPDVIVLDIMMPKMDGWSVLSLLSNHPNTANIPVVICSVVYDPELGEALGARAYLKKPLSEQELLAALQRSLGGPLAR